MTIENKQLQSIFPDYPRASPVLDKEGNFDPDWDLGLGALFQAAQNNFKSEGIVIPPLNQTQANNIQNQYASYIGGAYSALTLALPDISGQLMYNTSTQAYNQFLIGKDGSGNVTLAQWIPLSVLTTYAGNPNGNVAGILNWLCYDSTDSYLYICTTAGSASGASWTGIKGAP